MQILWPVCHLRPFFQQYIGHCPAGVSVVFLVAPFLHLPVPVKVFSGEKKCHGRGSYTGLHFSSTSDTVRLVSL